MVIPILAAAVRLFWVLVEFPYLVRHKVRPAKNWDKNSGRLWDAANLSEILGMVLGFAGIGRMQTSTRAIGICGLALLITGIIVRSTAIKTLGKYFTGTVLIKDDHILIRKGLYKYVRHPAYTGALLAHLGLGLSFSNWFALGFSTIPFIAVVAYRMRVEEQALTEAFGSEYVAYAQTSKRLIPRIY